MTGRKRAHSPSKASSSKAVEVLDLKKALDRRSFKEELTSPSTKTVSSSTVCSPRVSTRGSLVTTSQSRPKKASSAPVSPAKGVAVDTDKSSLIPNKRQQKGETSSGRKVFRSNLLLIKTDWSPSALSSDGGVKDSRPKRPSARGVSKSPSAVVVHEEPKQTIEDLPSRSRKMTLLSSDSNSRRKSQKYFKEVIRLHQDEGVVHLLHGLPSSRRKSTAVSATNVTVTRCRTSTDRTPSPAITSTQNQSPPPAASGFSNAEGLVRKSYPGTLQLQQASRQQNKPLHQETKYNALTVRLGTAKPFSTDELMSQKTLDILKRLPDKDYVRLWRSPTRYVLREPTFDSSSLFPPGDERQSASPTSEISDVSSASKHLESGSSSKPPLRNRPWSLNIKNFKDILVRTYPTFAQVILSPVTTGLRNTVNVNLIEELIDVMKQCSRDDDCKAVLVTGMGMTFSRGVDLTALAFEAVEKQRKSAEALATAIKNLVKFILGYPKILIAAVNGHAWGLGVALLPLFDIVFANDKATFGTDYVKLAQIPEAFSCHTLFSKKVTGSKVLLFGKVITADEALQLGIVSDIVWPDKFMEEIVPRIELFNDMPRMGLTIVKKAKMIPLSQMLSSTVIDEETKELVKNWTDPKFAKNLKQYLRENQHLFQ